MKSVVFIVIHDIILLSSNLIFL